MNTHSLTDTMQALVQDAYGDADVLRTDTVSVPTPGKGEVLVRVHAAGVDRGAWHLMAGNPHLVRLATGLRRPRQPVPGRELSGTVVQVGDGVTRFSPGDEVFGIGTGSFAEYAVAREAKLAHKPAAASYEQAAVTPVTGLTALQALRTGGVAAGQRVLVVGASGGIGSFAVQLAVAEGAVVTGVASTAKLDLVRSLGATEVIDYTVEDFAAAGPRFDLILDVGGLTPLSRLRSALKPTGTLVLVGGEGGGDFAGGTIGRQFHAKLLSLLGSQRLTGLLCKENAADLEVLAQLISTGAVTPTVGGVYPLARGAEAMRELVAGRVRGKVAITL
jgi:NADPH:quinone reductase-like Zn-dependent oxidoreductase